MRDIPVFTTTSGVASLTLKEIPYKGTAYIRMQDALCPEMLLKECVDFCRMAGAEYIFATGHSILETYPFYTEIWEMECDKNNLSDTEAVLVKAEESSIEKWWNIYNDKMLDVPLAATMTISDGQALLKSCDAYFVYRDETLLGIGKAAESRVEAVVSLVPGSGRDVLLALCRTLTSDRVTVEVASTNTRAINLYNRMGFVKTAEISKWYEIGNRCQ